MGLLNARRRDAANLVEACINLPNKEIVEKNGASIRKSEIVEFYIISTAHVMQVGNKTLYSVDRLLPLTPQPATGTWPLTALHPFSDGKTTMYVCEDSYTDTLREMNGQPLYELEPGGKMTLHLALFKFLATQRMALVKISAPKKWHANVAAARVHLDPSITCIWAPKFEKRPA